MVAAMCQALPRSFSDYKKNHYLFLYPTSFEEKHIVTQDYFVSTHKTVCFLENCKFHLVLIGTFSANFCRD